MGLYLRYIAWENDGEGEINCGWKAAMDRNPITFVYVGLGWPIGRPSRETLSLEIGNWTPKAELLQANKQLEVVCSFLPAFQYRD